MNKPAAMTREKYTDNRNQEEIIRMQEDRIGALRGRVIELERALLLAQRTIGDVLRSGLTPDANGIMEK